MNGSDVSRKYAYLDQLSTEELEEILCADIESPESGDEAMILYILEVIEKRENQTPTGRLVNVGDAWKEFQEFYNIPEGEKLSLYPMTDPEDATEGPDFYGDSKVDTGVGSSARAAYPHRTSRIFLKRLIPVAAAIAVLLAGMITAQAVGLDVFGALARWTDETFHFVSPQGRYIEPDADSPQDGLCPSAQELHDAFQAALDECGIEEPLAPTWFPEGCVMDGEPIITSTSYTSKIIFEYQTLAEHYFLICIQKYNPIILPEITATEKDAGPVEQYLSNGKLFYIMSNKESISSAWSDGQSISMKTFGDIPVESLKKLLDSIGE